MYSKSTKIINQLGIHGRPASKLTLKAKEFTSDITICNTDEENGSTVNAKSVMKVMMAGIRAGAAITISAEGEDEERAVNELVELIEGGFSEKAIVE